MSHCVVCKRPLSRCKVPLRSYRAALYSTDAYATLLAGQPIHISSDSRLCVRCDAKLYRLRRSSTLTTADAVSPPSTTDTSVGVRTQVDTNAATQWHQFPANSTPFAADTLLSLPSYSASSSLAVAPHDVYTNTRKRVHADASLGHRDGDGDMSRPSLSASSPARARAQPDVVVGEPSPAQRKRMKPSSIGGHTKRFVHTVAATSVPLPITRHLHSFRRYKKPGFV